MRRACFLLLAVACVEAEPSREISCDVHEAHAEVAIQRSDADVGVGPILWPGLKRLESAAPEGSGRVKNGVELEAGAVVTVSVAPEAQAWAGLRYGQAWDYSPAPAVTFHACNGSDTAFIGGFRVDGPRCVPLDVEVAGGETSRLFVSFFGAPCPDRDD